VLRPTTIQVHESLENIVAPLALTVAVTGFIVAFLALRHCHLPQHGNSVIIHVLYGVLGSGRLKEAIELVRTGEELLA